MLPWLAQRIAPRVAPLNLARVSMRTTSSLLAAQAPIQTRSFLTATRIAFADAKESTKSKRIAAGAKSGRTIAKRTTKTAAAKKKTAAAKKTKTAKAKPAKDVKPKIKAKKPKKRPTLMNMKIPKEAQPPKKPSSAYLLFASERAKGLGLNSLETAMAAARESSVLWRAMSEAEQRVWLDRATVLRDAYDRELKEWIRNADSRILQAYQVQRKAKGHHALPREYVKRFSGSGYNFFVKEYSKTYASTEGAEGVKLGQEIFSRAAGEWKQLSDVQKARYNEVAVQARAEQEKLREKALST
ncbi:hypothetical protein WOLCODRAFT_140741 [Wolfiporia cocos MD-104 SS10]|uniref:HMG box domain-containing protein n=1 Tax=Wolfiporia cocos (strain MD-104) TaxID=742152 RepID=A0A2H3J4J1_WOLCO|nr:hypothetical protein WOLCODRAFT_140741 [Wolfiporia cocos MD-104 SS10]